jgi:hypothetical protein
LIETFRRLFRLRQTVRFAVFFVTQMIAVWRSARESEANRMRPEDEILAEVLLVGVAHCSLGRVRSAWSDIEGAAKALLPMASREGLAIIYTGDFGIVIIPSLFTSL